MVKGGELTMDNKTNDTSGSVTIWPTNARVRQEVVASQKLDNVQTVIKKLQTDTNIVAGLVKKSNRLLLSISTHRFPIDIFPDTINIEESRITFITRDFFLSSQVHSIDIKDISHVINFDVPQHPEDYVHRIGRTVRADASGDAFTLVAPDEEPFLKRIEKFIKKTLPRGLISKFPYRDPP